MISPGRFLAAGARLARAVARSLRQRLIRRTPMPPAAYRFSETEPIDGWCVEIRLSSEAKVGAFETWRAWAQSQTLECLRLVQGTRSWAKPGFESSPAAFFYAPSADRPSDLPEDPAFLEGAALVLAAEEIDAVSLTGTRILSPAPRIEKLDELGEAEARTWTLFRDDAWQGPRHGAVELRQPKKNARAKILLPRGVVEPEATGAERSFSRRGSYLTNRDFGPCPELILRDASLYRRTGGPEGQDPRPRMLVSVPFLARGGAEHTIFETLYALRKRWQIAFVTLAPHRPELDDRRGDFQAIWPRLFCLGDFVHPAAMPGILAAIFDAFDPQVLYNANSTTLFFDFLPEIRRRRPKMLVVDHLYDHRVGYIERYRDPALRDQVDSIVAENRRIARALDEVYGWPLERAPVVWPCGRPLSEFPDDIQATRAAVRRELGIGAEEVVVLTAARMHPQKRPLDLVQLAGRLRDIETLRFLVVGGGELEEQVDEAIERAREGGARISRLPFRDDIPRLILASDAGCLVSDYEGLPVFLLECLQASRPFLGTDVGDLGFVLRGTGAGWVVDRPGDLDALEAAARSLMDPMERERRAMAARLAAPRFSVEASAERYDAVFRGEALEEIILAPPKSAEG